MLERVSGWPSYLEHVDFLKKTDAIRKHTCTGRPLGSRAFIEVAEKLTGRVLKPA